MPAPGALLRERCAHKAPRLCRLGLLGQTGSWIWRSACPPSDSGAGARSPWSESDRAHVYGRPVRRFFISCAPRDRLRQPTRFCSARRRLALTDAYISAAVRCAPPDNKPLPTELQNCRPYGEAELDILRPQAILALGGLALGAYLRILKNSGAISSYAQFPFRHGAVYRLPGNLPRIFTSYHPSQQNTFTGRLTHAMLTQVLRRIARYLATATSAARRTFRRR